MEPSLDLSFFEGSRYTHLVVFKQHAHVVEDFRNVRVGIRLLSGLTVYPQLLVNVRVKERKPIEQLPGVQREISQCETELDGFGRVLVRFSGTEPLLRVMVEGKAQKGIERLADRIVGAIDRRWKKSTAAL